MKRVFALVLVAILTSGVATARVYDVCEGELDLDDGVQATVSGNISKIEDGDLWLDQETDEEPFYCILVVQPKAKLPRSCKVGGTATVTGTTEYFLDANDLVNAEISCQ